MTFFTTLHISLTILLWHLLMRSLSSGRSLLAIVGSMPFVLNILGMLLQASRHRRVRIVNRLLL
jgi:hypothetical protein